MSYNRLNVVKSAFSALYWGQGDSERTSALNVFAVSIVAMEPDIYMTLSVSNDQFKSHWFGPTWNKYIFVVLHEIFYDTARIFNNINISPVYPVVHRPDGGIQEIVSSTANSLASRRLRPKAVAFFYTLTRCISEIALDDHGTAKTVRIEFILETFELLSQDGEGVILAVADQEG